jgi:hypothetical protein
MLHRPYSGNGTRLSGYYSGTPLLGPVLASVSGQLIEHGAPVAAPHGGVMVSGEPAWLPAPQRISPPPAARRRSDPVAPSALMNELPEFFQACGTVRVPARGPGFVPAATRKPSHSRRPDRTRPPVLHHPVGAPQRRKPGYVRLLPRHLLRRDVATLAGWPSDPGRDVLCLTSPPPRFRSP